MDNEKHPGQPPKYSSPEELKKKADEYFAEAIERNWKITITGLALWLGFQSRQSIYDYEKHGEFSYVIKRARLKVENAYESRLYEPNAGGAIFSLKNMGWKDKQEHEHNLSKETATLLGLIDGSSKGKLPTRQEVEDAG